MVAAFKTHPDFIFLVALLAVFPPAPLLLLLLELDLLERLQQLLFPQRERLVAGDEALQQLQHLHYLRNQTLHALFAVAVDELLHLGADQLGYFVHIIHG